MDAFIEDLLTIVDTFIETFVFATFRLLAEALSDIFAPAAILAVTIFWLYVAYGRASPMPLLEFAGKVTGILLIIVFSTDADLYAKTAYQMIYEGSEDLIQAVSGSRANLFRQFGDLLANLGDVIYEAWNASGLLSAAYWVLFGAFVFTPIYIGLMFSVMFIVIVSKFIMGLMLGVGNLFIACLLFGPTRHLFEGWLKILIGGALLSFFAHVLLKFCLTLMIRPVRIAMQNPDMFDFTYAIIICGLMILSAAMFWLLAGICYAITGSMVVNTGLVFAAAKNISRRLSVPAAVAFGAAASGIRNRVPIIRPRESS